MLCCLSTVSTYTEKTIKMFGGASLSNCMQHVLTVLTYPGSCKSCFSCIPVFGGKVFLIFPIQTVDLKLICIIGQSDLINPLILLIATLDDIFTHFGGFFFIFMGQLALKFHWDKTCFVLACINSVYIQITLKLLDQSCQNLFDDCAGGSQGVQLLD